MQAYILKNNTETSSVQSFHTLYLKRDIDYDSQLWDVDTKLQVANWISWVSG